MSTETETLKSTVERFSVAGNQAFKDSVEKTLGAINEMNSMSKGNVEALVESMTAATKGAETVGAHAMALSKKHWEDTIASAKTLSTAKSMQEVIELQSNWAKSALETYVSEMNALTETMTASFKDAYKPINARMTMAVEKFQSYR